MKTCEGCGVGYAGLGGRHEGYCPMCSETIDIIEAGVDREEKK